MSTNRVDALANNLAKAGGADRIEGALDAFDLSSATEEEKESWYHLRGITAYQRGDREEAHRRFLIARDHYPRSPMIAFSLGQEEEFVGNLDRAFELFHEVRFPGAPANFVLAAARYAYLWNRLSDGLTFLESIFAAYEKVGILDDHYLYVRGLPFFSSTWLTAATLHRLQGTIDVLRRRTEAWSKTLRDYDFGALLAALDLDPGRRRAELERRIREWEGKKWPTGFARVELAVLESQAADSLASAEAALTRVTLGEHDHGWLADILLLASCAARERFGAPDEECISRFLQRQQYLFEPEHVFRFHLVEYQERLKPRYRARRG